MAMLFSVKRSFSEHLKRWEDNELPDKYDHNCFEYSAQPTQEEFEKALAFQRERGDAFIKLEGDFPLENDFGLSPGVTLTMQLSGSTDDWILNDEVEIRKPRYKDIIEIERKHFGPVYGEDFSVHTERTFPSGMRTICLNIWISEAHIQVKSWSELIIFPPHMVTHAWTD